VSDKCAVDKLKAKLDEQDRMIKREFEEYGVVHDKLRALCDELGEALEVAQPGHDKMCPAADPIGLAKRNLLGQPKILCSDRCATTKAALKKWRGMK